MKTALRRRIDATDGQIDGAAARAHAGGDRDRGGGGQVEPFRALHVKALLHAKDFTCT